MIILDHQKSFSDGIKNQIIMEFEGLYNQGITYLSYILIGQLKTFRFSTDKKWLYETFLDQGLNENCPLKKLAFSNLSRVIPWSSLSLNCYESKVMDARKEHKQLNGITLVNDFTKTKEVIAMATCSNKFNIEESYFLNNIVYKNILLKIRKLGIEGLNFMESSSYAKPQEQQQLYYHDKLMEL